MCGAIGISLDNGCQKAKTILPTSYTGGANYSTSKTHPYEARCFGEIGMMVSRVQQVLFEVLAKNYHKSISLSRLYSRSKSRGRGANSR